jgi:2,5-diketo-D-gluconate reductase A
VEGAGGEDARALAETNLTRLMDHNLRMLGLEYVDLLILHNPCLTEAQSLARYRMIEQWHRRGKSRAIGVSNFDAAQITSLMANATIKPAVNQAGFSLGHPQTWWMDDLDRVIKPAMAKSRALNVTWVAYGPLGQTTRQGVQTLVGEPTVAAIGTRHGKSGAQVALRWIVQQGIPVVTAGNNFAHYTENLGVTGFELSHDEMGMLEHVL